MCLIVFGKLRAIQLNRSPLFSLQYNGLGQVEAIELVKKNSGQQLAQFYYDPMTQGMLGFTGEINGSYFENDGNLIIEG